MLSISNVGNSAAAGNYYEQADDYYSRDRSPSAWSGSVADELGLSGTVKAEIFRALLDGRLPTGEQIHHAGAGRRGGTDLTFSAPKSVSIQALIAGDLRLLAAHEAAVSRALDFAQSLGACRVTADGLTTRQSTGKLLVAQFRHDLSRAADPQLHTHCVVLNVTRRQDGAWRALDNEPLYRHKMFLGAYYRSELAGEVQALGYDVRVTHADGRFELAHIEPAQIKIFSNRSQMIEQALQRQGITRKQASARQLQVAALQTRQAKTEHDRSALKTDWLDRASAAAINLHLPNPAVDRTLQNTEDAVPHAMHAVSHAAAHLGEREAVMQRIDLLRAALEFGTGRTDLKAIESAVEQAAQSGELVRAGKLYTTPAAQQREREILTFEVAGRSQFPALMTPEAVQQALTDRTLNVGQSEAVHHILCAQNSITGVQGSAGTGKTTALRVVRELAEKHGLKPVGLAPSAGAARELAHTGMPSQTLAALATRGYAGLDKDTLVVLDEAGMVSARDMHGLLSAASLVGARVVLVGDVQQLKAVEAGRPFAQLQAAGMATARLHEIQRQREPELKEAVRLAAEGKVADSLTRLQRTERSVVEIEPHGKRHAQMAADYAALTPQGRNCTLIVAGTHRHREAINEKVRQELGLAGEGCTLTTLSRKDLSQAQALRTVSYEAGDVVRADRDYKTLGLQRGDTAHVVDGPAGVVSLQLGDGRQVQWRPVQQPNMSAYVEHQRELAVGDVVRITRNDPSLGLVNGERATVKALPDLENEAPGKVVLQKFDGSTIALGVDTPLFLEHGYCQTVHAAQGQTCERILIEVPTVGGMGNESSYYVAISRATHAAVIYTDDEYSLPASLARADEKSAALDLHDANQPIHELIMELG